MKISVFTSTYNRGYIIEKLYNSLKKQTYKDFEWIVIDDGSIDNTEKLFNKWIKEKNTFTIKYKKVENGGKHRAINKGVEMAKGEMFFIVDSDDYLTNNSLEQILLIDNGIPLLEKHKYCGICGKKGYSNKKEIGTSFIGEYLDTTNLERNKYGISGDKAEVFYTNTLKKYKFPEIKDENFITECIVWNKMAKDGLMLRYFNNIIYICKYREDGLTAQGNEIFYKNPIGWGMFIRQSVDLKLLTGLEKWYTYLDYFEKMKYNMKFHEISKNLGCNEIMLYNRLFWMRVFHKLYSK